LAPLFTDDALLLSAFTAMFGIGFIAVFLFAASSIFCHEQAYHALAKCQQAFLFH